MTQALARRLDIGGRETRLTACGGMLLREQSDGGDAHLTGYAAVTEVPYTMQDWLGEYEEIVRTGAWTKTLADKADVRLLFNHDGLPLARTKSGTLDLREIADGKDDPLEQYIGLAALQDGSECRNQGSRR